MAIVTPDFSEAKTQTAIQPGIYNMRIVGAELKNSRAGTGYIKWTMQVFGAAGAQASANNQKVWTNTMLSGPGAGRLHDLCKAALGNVPSPLDTDHLIGREVQAVLVEGRNQDGTVSPYPDVKSVKALR